MSSAVVTTTFKAFNFYGNPYATVISANPTATALALFCNLTSDPAENGCALYSSSITFGPWAQAGSAPQDGLLESVDLQWFGPDTADANGDYLLTNKVIDHCKVIGGSRAISCTNTVTLVSVLGSQTSSETSTVPATPTEIFTLIPVPFIIFDGVEKLNQAAENTASISVPASITGSQLSSGSAIGVSSSSTPNSQSSPIVSTTTTTTTMASSTSKSSSSTVKINIKQSWICLLLLLLAG